jgi:GTP-binding protein Era
VDNQQKNHLTISLVGEPNAGKSTLTNSLVGQKIVITSPKPQTTRNSIKAIAIHNNSQLIFIDTPGLFIPKQDRLLERIIVKSAWQGLRSSDLVAFVFDSSCQFSSRTIKILEEIKKENIPTIIIINKIDLVKKSKLLEIIAKFAEMQFSEILMISAKNNDGIEQLLNLFASNANKLGWQFDEDQISDAPIRFLATEITREKLFIYLNDELPYSLTVKNVNYQILDNGDIKIHQDILVQKESHKKIILGKNGSLIKKIGQESRMDIAKITNSKVHLYLFVKVKDDWMNSSENYEIIDIDKLPNKAKNHNK